MIRTLRIQTYTKWVFTILAISTVLILEKNPTLGFHLWGVRVFAGISVLLFWWGTSKLSQRVKRAPWPSHLPVEPLPLLELLKSLKPLEPHCMWSGELGQLWGIYLKGHMIQVPYAQNGHEVWLVHLQGKKTLIDAVKGARAVEEGQFLKLPQGVGPSGFKSDGAYIAWVTPKARVFF